MQTHERADVEKIHAELTAAKAALAAAIAEARELEHKVWLLMIPGSLLPLQQCP